MPECVGVLGGMLDKASVFLTTVLIVMLIFTFFIDPVKVSGVSMEDTLFDNDRLIVRTLFYRPAAGDVVVCRSEQLNELIVKRVIAVGGQHVSIDYNEGTVSVNGKILDEPYLKYHALDDTGRFDMQYYDPERATYEYDVPMNYVFLMGDNRNNSNDSRLIGAVNNDDVIGKAVFRFYSERAKSGAVK